MALMRLHKVLSEAGVASRRGAETLIADGRVSVNGHTTRVLGLKADPESDEIRVDGKLVPPRAPKAYYVLYKPRGVVTSLKDPDGRSTIKDLTPHIKPKVFPVGRLDYDSEGLLLLTNDGQLALKLSHPRYGVPRTYLVKVKGVLSQEEIRRLEQGIKLEDGMSPPLKIRPVRKLTKNSWLRITLREGRNRVIKRTFQAIHHPVLQLKRITYASLTLSGLKPGDYRPLSPREVQRLREWG